MSSRGRLSYPAPMLFLHRHVQDHDGGCTDFTVHDGSPRGRTVGRIYKDISAGGRWFWCLNDRAPSPAADRGYAPDRAKAMLSLKHRWLQRGPLKPGEMQMGTPAWMKEHPDYKHVSD